MSGSTGTSRHPFQLALGTRFHRLIVDSAPGGLPSDFLSYASSTLLLCDKILCDQEAFDCEMDFAARKGRRSGWLSSLLFKELFEARILQPTDYRKLLAVGVEACRAAGVDVQIRESMERKRAALLKGKRGSALSIDPDLKSLDRGFLLELSNLGIIPYAWRENFLKPAPYGGISSERNDLSGFGLGRLTVAFPHCPVLLSPAAMKEVNPRAYDAIVENIEQERVPLALWMNDDSTWTRERYVELRLGPQFRSKDRMYDRAQEREARQNLDNLLRIRSRTTSERAAIQELLLLALTNRSSPDDVRKDLRAHEASFKAMSVSKRRFSIEAAVTAISTVSGVASFAYGAVGVAAPGLAATTLGALDVARQARRSRRARGAEPIGYLYGRLSADRKPLKFR